MRSEFLEPVLNGEDRTAEKHEVAGRCRGDCVAGDFIHCSALQRKLRLVRVAIPADNLAGELGRSKRQADGCSYETGSDDGYAVDQSTGISALMFRFTAVAMMRSWSMSLSNYSGNNDWAPSERALSGWGCTSISSPSHPAATAARAMGATLSRRPTPWEGSGTPGGKRKEWYFCIYVGGYVVGG